MRHVLIVLLVLLSALNPISTTAAHAECPQGIPDGIPELIIKMPYPSTIDFIEHDCNQGPCGDTSHYLLFTQYALDLDTPNDGDPRIVLAPIDGMAYAYDTPNIGIGRHVKIDIGDGTYIVLGHLHDFFIPVSPDSGDPIGTPVQQGQRIARENNSCEPKPGCSGGDHIHLDRLYGNADRSNITRDVSVPYKIWTKRSCPVDPYLCDLGVETEFRLYDPSEFICCDKCPNYDSNNIEADCVSLYNDLDCWHWARPYWSEMTKRGIFTGTDCLYDPDLTCIFPQKLITRAELAKVAMIAMNMDIILPPPDDPFVDMTGHSLHDYVATLWYHGVVQGCDPTHFCPDNPVTRAETTKILIETARVAGHDIDLAGCTSPPFPDVPIHHSLCTYVRTANDRCYDFVDGFIDDESCSDACTVIFGPDRSIDRSQVAKIVYGMLAWINNGEQCLGE